MSKKLYDKLTKRQQKTMQRHSKHHTKKHMQTMRKAMGRKKNPLSFTKAHKLAMSKVGR